MRRKRPRHKKPTEPVEIVIELLKDLLVGVVAGLIADFVESLLR